MCKAESNEPPVDTFPQKPQRSQVVKPSLISLLNDETSLMVLTPCLFRVGPQVKVTLLRPLGPPMPIRSRVHFASCAARPASSHHHSFRDMSMSIAGDDPFAVLLARRSAWLQPRLHVAKEDVGRSRSVHCVVCLMLTVWPQQLRRRPINMIAEVGGGRVSRAAC